MLALLNAERQASYDEADLSKPGGAFEPTLPNNRVMKIGEDGEYMSDWGQPTGPDDWNGLALAIYSFSLLGYSEEPLLTTEWLLEPDWNSLWLGLANWPKNEWDWHQTNHRTVDLGDMPYVHPDGTVLVVVAITGNSSDLLEQLIFGALPGEWLMFGHNPQHTRRSPYIGAQTNNVKWSYTTGGSIMSSPAIGADGTIYVGSHDDKLYAINPDGTEKWSYITGDSVYIWSSPAIGADGTVYVGIDEGLESDEGKLLAINPDGSLKWSYTTGGRVYSSPVIGVDGTVYVGSGYPDDCNLYAINPNGSLKWVYTTGAYVPSSPAIGVDGTVYVGSYDHKLYAINPSGTKEWEYATGDWVLSSPAIGADGTVYVGSYDGKLYAINPGGSLKWAYTTGIDDYVHSSPAIGADGTVYVGSGFGKFCAINPGGSLKWEYITGNGVQSSPAISADGTVYVGSFEGKLYAFGP